MRIAYLPDGRSTNTAYRSIGPMRALAQRGHDVRQLSTTDSRGWGELLRWCELLHIHRVCDSGAVELARAAGASGAAVVWDDDDDVTKIPRQLASHRTEGGLRGSRRLAERSKLFKTVDLVTTPSANLARGFQEGGARAVQVIENYVIDDCAVRRLPREGLRIGWVAARAHRLDAQSIPIVPALRRLLDEHPQVHVATIGIQIEVESERYTPIPFVPLSDLLTHVATFDIGIAPLSPDWAINHARSNIKLKEYATAGVPWLASPIGPYAGMGEQEGGRLVPDDGWYEHLDTLVRNGRLRRKLAKRAAKWAGRQSLSGNVTLWEQAFQDAIARRRALVEAGTASQALAGR